MLWSRYILIKKIGIPKYFGRERKSRSRIIATITGKEHLMKPIKKSVDDVFGILHSPSVITQSIEDMDNAIRRHIAEAWAEEAERRIDAYDAGKISARPVEDVMRDLKL